MNEHTKKGYEDKPHLSKQQNDILRQLFEVSKKQAHAQRQIQIIESLQTKARNSHHANLTAEERKCLLELKEEIEKECL